MPIFPSTLSEQSDKGVLEILKVHVFLHTHHLSFRQNQRQATLKKVPGAIRESDIRVNETPQYCKNEVD